MSTKWEPPSAFPQRESKEGVKGGLTSAPPKCGPPIGSHFGCPRWGSNKGVPQVGFPSGYPMGLPQTVVHQRGPPLGLIEGMSDNGGTSTGVHNGGSYVAPIKGVQQGGFQKWFAKVGAPIGVP
jgi:hypothetical protein